VLLLAIKQPALTVTANGPSAKYASIASLMYQKTSCISCPAPAISFHSASRSVLDHGREEEFARALEQQR